MICSILLFAARRARTILSMNDIPTVIIVCCVILLIIAVACEFIKQMRRAENQRQLDIEHRNYYLQWHDMIAMSGTIEPVKSPYLLDKGEECLWVEPDVSLYEVRSVQRSSHTFGSMPLGNSHVRIGRGYSNSESTDEWQQISHGQLYITNKCVYFDGDKFDRRVSLGAIATLKADWSGIELSSDKYQKSMIFTGVNGKVCQEIVMIARGQDVVS